MTSQIDYDQSGTTRQAEGRYLGPSVGWAVEPQAILPVATVGTFTAAPGTTLVTVNVAGSVTVILPSTIRPAAGAMTQPGRFTDPSITVTDIGGNATAFPITIQPAAGDTIAGLAQITISVNFGAYTLRSNQHLWAIIA
jgi:hypothetical protein